MCNLYSMTTNQKAIRDLFKVTRDTSGNLPRLPAIFPDQMAPVVRAHENERELMMMRWGMPNPPQFPAITTNIRNTKSPHWRRWLAPESRCLIPFTSFCEYADTKPKKTPKWFAMDETRPLVAFAGIWTEWNGVRGNSNTLPVGPQGKMIDRMSMDKKEQLRTRLHDHLPSNADGRIVYKSFANAVKGRVPSCE